MAFSLQLHRTHRILILRVMENIIKEYIDVIDEDMAKEIITLGSRELTLANVNY